MKKTLMFTAAIALVATPLFAQNVRAVREDANSDGSVTLAESRAVSEVRFTKMDANNDGVLNATDRDAMKAKRDAQRAEKRAAIDTDGNGEFTLAEMQAAANSRMAKRFASLDADKSGSISATEMAASRDYRGNKGPGEHMRGGKPGGKHDGPRGEHGPRGADMMKMIDSNGDGAISKAEFVTASDKRFNLSDADKDGKVTQEERKAAWGKLRDMRDDGPDDIIG